MHVRDIHVEMCNRERSEGREGLSKQWSEDPLVVSFDAVVGADGFAAAATGDADEGAVGARRIIFAAWRFFTGSGIDDGLEARVEGFE